MLSGIRVLSFTHYIQGPCASQYLADLGADVIKVEPLEGAFERRFSNCDYYPGGESMFFLLGNRNQKSLSIDLKTSEGTSTIKSLIKTSDVIVENYRPGVMDKLGLGYENVRDTNPRIVYASCSGYGRESKKAGQDILVEAYTGLASLNKKEPKGVGTPVIDQHGAIMAALGIVVALLNREKTNRGMHIETSLLGSAVDLEQEALSYCMNGIKQQYVDTGLACDFHQAPSGIYRTKDGFIAVTLVKIAQLKRVFPGVFDSFSEESRFKDNRIIDLSFSKEIKKKETCEIIKAFESEGIWYEKYNTLEDFAKCEDEINIHEINVNGHEVKLVGHQNKYDGEYPKLRIQPPDLGASNISILKEIGYMDCEIEKLMEKGIVGYPKKQRRKNG